MYCQTVKKVDKKNTAAIFFLTKKKFKCVKLQFIALLIEIFCAYEVLLYMTCTLIISWGKRSFEIVGHMRSTVCKNKNNSLENCFSRNKKSIIIEPVNLQPYNIARPPKIRIHWMRKTTIATHSQTQWSGFPYKSL